MGFSPDGGYEPDAGAAKVVPLVAKYLVGCQRPVDLGFTTTTCSAKGLGWQISDGEILDQGAISFLRLRDPLTLLFGSF